MQSECISHTQSETAMFFALDFIVRNHADVKDQNSYYTICEIQMYVSASSTIFTQTATFISQRMELISSVNIIPISFLNVFILILIHLYMHKSKYYFMEMFTLILIIFSVFNNISCTLISVFV